MNRDRKKATDPSGLMRRAETARRQGEPAQAAGLYAAVLARYPANRRARNGLRALGAPVARQIAAAAQALEAKGRHARAEEQWHLAALICPESIAIAVALARCRQRLGRLTAGLEGIAKILAIHPHAPEPLDMRGCLLRDLGQFDAAERSFEEALRGTPGDAAPLNHLGTLAQARGDLVTASAYYRRALACRPDAADLHANLAAVSSYVSGDPHIAEMEALLPEAAPAAQAALHFALFRAHDATGDRQRAFDHLIAGNALRKAAIGYDIARDAVIFGQLKAMLSAPVPDIRPGRPGALRPIFVVGLPRTGTTLVERILSRCEGVQAAGELSVVSHVAEELLADVAVRPDPALTADNLAGFRDRVLKDLRIRSDGAPVIVDKMPLNFRWAGLICAALPEARILRMERAPMAVAWSLYRNSFAGPGNGYAYDMADIVAYMALFRDLSAACEARFPDRIRAVDYAALVESPETSARALLDHCGLPWSTACLTPAKTDPPALTASAVQVRRPIYRGADDAWRRYAFALRPLVEGLSAAGFEIPRQERQSVALSDP
ncbi:sulfotransferase [Sulfitobacter sp. LCG007]